VEELKEEKEEKEGEEEEEVKREKEYKLDLSVPYERAVCQELLRAVAAHKETLVEFSHFSHSAPAGAAVTIEFVRKVTIREEKKKEKEEKEEEGEGEVLQRMDLRYYMVNSASPKKPFVLPEEGVVECTVTVGRKSHSHSVPVWTGEIFRHMLKGCVKSLYVNHARYGYISVTTIVVIFPVY